MRLLRQPALEVLTRSARTDSPRQVGRNKFRRLEAAAVGGGGGFEERLSDGFGSGPTGPDPTDEHSVHLHHRDFIVTPIADQIGPIDSVSKTECLTRSARTDSPRSSWPDKFRRLEAAAVGGGGGFEERWGRRLLELGITDSACKKQLVVVSVRYGPFNPYIPIRSTTIGKSRVAIDPIAMRTSWRSKSDITSVTSIGYPRMSASGESSTTMHRLLHASGSHPILPPNDPNPKLEKPPPHSTPPTCRSPPVATRRRRPPLIDRTCYDQFFEENPSVLISLGLLVQADEGVSLPVVDLIDESTAAYREEPVFL
ncbi:translation initiation factor IF-2, chloroplastic-like [Dorcoceras hygrometricum]|uniref:Translation initiation factor IF-2, chloroplastic-like n=1 Tax=Dorcoceras hygrometricum TaxID=472368 RepID=A0A2Z7CFZ1_9LAMI|nr:translation initiation factor IF-2, chloroplastic-like [Dorcoceras hygrometricum]